jgi:fructokinase
MTQSSVSPIGKIAVGGENLIDFVETGMVDGIPQYSANPGGSPFNLAIAASRQGSEVEYLTPVSKDRLGNLLAERLTDSGVRLAAPRLDAPTSLAVVSLEDGQPSYQFYRKGTAERQITWDGLQSALKDRPWVFHIGSLGLSGGDDADLWERFFLACHDQGVITSLDPNVRPSLIEDRAAYIERLERMFKHADIIKLSDEDIEWLYPDRPLMAAFDHLQDLSSDGLRVLTMGAQGVHARCGKTNIEVGARPVKTLVDTVGAGDTFMATMLSWLAEEGVSSRSELMALNSDHLTAMMERSSLAASLNCEKRGCNPPYLKELM